MPAERSVSDWRSIRILILAGFVAAFHVGKAAIAVPLLRADLNLSLLVASIIVSAFATLGAFGGLAAGVAVSRLPTRNTVVGGLLVIGAGSMLGAAATSWPILLATRAIEGCGFLAVVIAIPSLIRVLAAPRDRAFALACWGVYLPAGSAIMMLAGPSLSAFGWQGLWLVNGATTTLYALVVWQFIAPEAEAPPVNPTSIIVNLRTVITAPGPVLAALAFGTYTFHYFALTALMPTLLIERMGLTVGEAGAVSAATVVANAAGNRMPARPCTWAFRFGTIIGVAFACCGVAASGIFAAWLPSRSWRCSPPPAAITAWFPPQSSQQRRLAPSAHLLGITLGLVIQASNFGQLLGPAALAAWVENFGWSSAPLLFAAIAAVTIMIALCLRALLPA